MYAQRIVEEKLALAQKELGFALEYHSPEEVEDFARRLRASHPEEYDQADLASASAAQFPFKAGQSSLLSSLCDPRAPKLLPEELRWIQNERALAMCDAAYFLTRYFWIKNIHNELQRFTFRAAQRIYFDIIAELEERGLSKELLVDKARQLGMSTETAGCILQAVLFTFGTSATMASFDQSKTAEMANMLFLGYDMLPWWLPPAHTRRVESDRGMIVFGGQRSQIKLQHGTQTGGISQGATPTVYHLSEVAYYPNPEELIEVGLFKAVHPSPKVFGVLESTACGDTGWWYDKYWYYKRRWPQCRMLSTFLPWFLGTDLYPNETWLRKSPPPLDWAPREETREMIARAQLYVASSSVLQKVLGGSGWFLPKEQAWWWEVQFLEALDGGKTRTFFQEYPTDDQESFQGSYESVFGGETIAQVWTRRDKGYSAYGVVGQSIEEKNEPHPDDVDYDRPRERVVYRNQRGESFQWELVPLRWKDSWNNPADLRNAKESEIPNNIYMEFLPPEAGFDYSLGIDTSTGVGDEATVLAMSRRSLRGDEPDFQAAEFRSNLVSHVETYPYAMMMAARYAQKMQESGVRFREPYVSVEQVQAVGDTVYKDMLKMGYARFHRMTRYDSAPKKMRKVKSSKIGWFTYNWSRPILLDTFVVAVQNGWYVVNSPWTIWEMQHWETHLTGGGKEKKVHSEDSTDDGIFANALAFFCPNDLRSLTERTKKKCPGPSEEGSLPPVDIAPWGGLALPLRAPKEELEAFRG